MHLPVAAVALLGIAGLTVPFCISPTHRNLCSSRHPFEIICSSMVPRFVWVVCGDGDARHAICACLRRRVVLVPEQPLLPAALLLL